jgi:hypothetical protein
MVCKSSSIYIPILVSTGFIKLFSKKQHPPFFLGVLMIEQEKNKMWDQQSANGMQIILLMEASKAEVAHENATKTPTTFLSRWR